MAKFMITSIDWETDGEEVSLPTEELVDGADDADAAVDALSDKYGWLIKNCSVEEFKDRELIAQLICGRGQCYCARPLYWDRNGLPAGKVPCNA